MLAWNHVWVMLLGLGLYVYWGRKYLGYRFSEMLRDYLPSVVLSALMVLAAWGIGKLPVMPAVKLILQILIGAAVYVVLSVVTGNKSFRTILGFAKGLLQIEK